MKKFKTYFKKIFKIIKRPEMAVLPGQIAFFLFLSLIPTITLIGYLSSFINVSMTDVINVLGKILPDGIVGIIVPALTPQGLATFTYILVGFFLASNATNSIIIASNMLFKLETGTYIRRRIKAFFMLIIFVFLILFSLIVIGFGDNIIEFIFSFIGETPGFIKFIYVIFKYTLGLWFLYIFVKVIFTMAPDSPIPSKNMNKGSLFTTVAFFVSTTIYSIYVTSFANYNAFYGSLSNIIVLMIWIYILSYGIVIGIAINSEDYLSEISSLKNFVKIKKFVLKKPKKED